MPCFTHPSAPEDAGETRPLALTDTNVLTVHRLADSDLVAVATGETDQATMARLRSGAHSRRLVLLRAVLDRAATVGGPLPPASAAWDLLVAAERADAAVVRDVLDHPTIGIWAAQVLRRGHTATDNADLWAATGYLHAIAAAAAIRVGLSFTAYLPLRAGVAFLPTMGAVTFAGESPFTVAEIHSSPSVTRIVAADATVTLPADRSADAPGWLAMRQLRIAEGDRQWQVWLDDLDPYRGFNKPLPPDRLSAADFDEWRSTLSHAFALLARHHPHIADQLSSGLSVLIPKRIKHPAHPVSATSADGFGAAAIGLPDAPDMLAAALIHEFWHSKLNVLLDLVELHHDDWQPVFYAPWRDDPRPVGGVLHGVYSHLGLADFWRIHRRFAESAAFAHFEFAVRHEQVRQALAVLRTSGLCTDIGQRFVAEMTRIVDTWRTELATVPEPIAGFARLATADHYATWRLRHLRPDPDLVAALADAWCGGRAADVGRQPQPVLTDASGTTETRARITLTRLRLRDPQRFWGLRATSVGPAEYAAGATDADFQLIAGNPTAAAETYRQQIATGSDPIPGWIGLGLALAADNQPAGRTLLARPELVRAVYRRLVATSGSAPEPDTIASWLHSTPD